jgi:heme/copper-type cytochrome/quinol oxidase subunit 3
MEASAPHTIQPEPPEWQPRALWANARLLCGAISFFFAAFLFGYFYLRSIDSDNKWIIGNVNPSVGMGAAIFGLYLASAVLFRLGIHRPKDSDTLSTAIIAAIFGLVAIALQCIQYTNLDFGPASGGYASIFIGWTALYAVLALVGVVWIEIQAATLWRAERDGTSRDPVLRAGLEACSFYWAYFVAIGVLAFIVLYLV